MITNDPIFIYCIPWYNIICINTEMLRLYAKAVLLGVEVHILRHICKNSTWIFLTRKISCVAQPVTDYIS